MAVNCVCLDAIFFSQKLKGQGDWVEHRGFTQLIAYVPTLLYCDAKRTSQSTSWKDWVRSLKLWDCRKWRAEDACKKQYPGSLSLVRGWVNALWVRETAGGTGVVEGNSYWSNTYRQCRESRLQYLLILDKRIHCNYTITLNQLASQAQTIHQITNVVVKLY